MIKTKRDELGDDVHMRQEKTEKNGNFGFKMLKTENSKYSDGMATAEYRAGFGVNCVCTVQQRDTQKRAINLSVPQKTGNFTSSPVTVEFSEFPLHAVRGSQIPGK